MIFDWLVKNGIAQLAVPEGAMGENRDMIYPASQERPEIIQRPGGCMPDIIEMIGKEVESYRERNVL